MSVIIKGGSNSNLANVDSNESVQVALFSGSPLPAGTNNLGKINILGNAGAALDAVVGAAPPANAIQISGLASTTLPASTTAGDTVVPMADIAGRLIVRSGGPRERCVTAGITITASTGSNSLIGAGAGGVFRDLTMLQASNSSATGSLITISDGTVSYIWYLAPTGGGFNINFDPPLKATTAATGWTATCGSSVSSVYVSAQAVETN